MQRIETGFALRLFPVLRRWPVGVLLSAVAATVAAAALGPVRADLGDDNVALIFLLIAVLAAAGWGWQAGLCASLLCNLFYNWFFVPPLYSINLTSAHEWLVQTIFLGVAALTSLLVAIGRARADEARRRAHDLETLLSLTEALIGAPEPEAALRDICRRAVESFRLESCAVVVEEEGAPRIAAASDAAATLTERERDQVLRVLRSGAPTSMSSGENQRVLLLPMLAAGRVLGVVHVRAEAERLRSDSTLDRMLRAFADEAALAFQRAALARQAAQAAVLVESDRLKSALLSSVSHDLRSPLASIKTAASSLVQSDIDWDPAARRGFLIAIDEEVDRLSRLVSNLLDMSRIEAGVLRPRLDWVDVADLAQTVVERLAPLARDHDLQLDLPDDLPLVRADYVQIDQVLTNLVENAIKYSPADTAISVAARAGEQLELRVSDRGSGVPAGDLERIFEKFYRLPATAAMAKGTGIGLAICRGIVEAHGGRICAEPRPGGGTSFVCTLPLARPAALRGEEKPPASAGAAL